MIRGSFSFVARIARITVLVAAVGAAFTAIVSTYIAHRLIVAGMDRRLRGAAVALADEIATLSDQRAIDSDVDEDSRELHHSGLQIAVFEGSRLLAGDAGTPVAAGPGCASQAGVRLCAVPSGRRLVVVAGASGELSAQLRLFGEAAALAVLVTIVAALLIARGLAARVMGPLTRLRHLVATVPDHSPGAVTLGADEGWEEVDALRAVLMQLLARLDRALVQARSFAADAAHELRTPVATMRAELELLAEDPGEGGMAAVKEAIGRVHRTLLAASALIERLLILALPADGDAPEGQAVAMADVLREAVTALPESSRARVAVEITDEGIVRGDASLFRALADNALDNALKFGAGGPVVVRVAARDGRVVTTFQDSGPGIPPAERQRVFQPFYRTREARASTVRGHGIGLALIAHVAAGHGGQAAFRDVERGALLEIVLPAWAPAAP
jgi:two-component system OmpR family sensor kinase